MSEIKNYTFKDCNIRIIRIDGEYWFCIKDLWIYAKGYVSIGVIVHYVVHLEVRKFAVFLFLCLMRLKSASTTTTTRKLQIPVVR